MVIILSVVLDLRKFSIHIISPNIATFSQIITECKIFPRYTLLNSLLKSALFYHQLIYSHYLKCVENFVDIYVPQILWLLNKYGRNLVYNLCQSPTRRNERRKIC